MNIQQFLLDYLLKNDNASLPQFGEFYLKNSTAFLDIETSIILPPRKEIFFNQNENQSNDLFTHFVSKNNKKSFTDSEFEIIELVKDWKKQLKENKELKIEEIGIFYYKASKLCFKGQSIQTNSAENYGLEEINLLKLNSINTRKQKSGNYQFNNSILWLFLLIIPILGLLYLGITQQERIFGKKSFQELSQKNATHRIEKAPIKIDTAKINEEK